MPEIVEVSKFIFDPANNAVFVRMFRNKAAYDHYQRALNDEMVTEWNLLKPDESEAK